MRFISPLEITTTELKIDVNCIINCSALFYFYAVFFLIGNKVMPLLPAPEISTTEGKNNVNSIQNCSTFVLFVCYNLFSFIIIVRFFFSSRDSYYRR